MALDSMLFPVHSPVGNDTEKRSPSLRRASSAIRPSRGKPILIRISSEPDELEEIYRFRYQIYVEEMDRRQIYADHVTRRIEDPLDDDAYNFAAFDEDRVVGVVRGNFARTSDIDYYETFMDMGSVGPFHPFATSICTRLMVAPRLRRTSLAMRLARATYAFGLRNQIRYNFIDCDDHLIGFFTRLGYIFHRRAEHPEHGIGNVMRLDMLDRAHLARQNSPFLATLDQSGAVPATAARLH